MKKWLDKYNDDVPQAQNGIEGTMGGLTDKGFNYNGAWGGTMQMGGAMPGAVGFTYARTGSIPSNGKYAKKTKASAQDGKNVEYKELPEIVVVGGKDKPTVDLYRNELDKLDPTSPEGNPYSGGLPYAAYYAKMQMAKEFGVPKIRPAKPVGKVQSFFRNRSGVKSDPNETWPQYSPFTKTVYSGFDNDQEYEKQYIPELSHYLSQKNQGTLDYLKGGISNFLEYAKGNNPYDIKGTEENIAHEQLEPMLREAYDKFWKEGRNKFSEAAGNSMKRKIYERNKKLQNGGEMKFYQEGLDWKPRNISRNGSEIPVDPMGYWNPDNVGEPVIIPSNEITMEGVYQPLLGISDTGDTQMMYPGEDYEFDGESVTEYPVAQKGKTLPTVYTENPRDPRIRAYQDSLNLYEFVGSKNPSEIKRLKESYYRLKERNKVSPQPIKSSTLGNITFNEAYKKPVQPVKYRKPEPKKEQPKPTPTIVERKQNVYEGSPVYSGTIGSGGPSALVGFANQKGDTTFIKPEDYERFGVPKYGKEFIQNRKKQRNGGVNNADAQPIEKLDQLLNFTNYNKPTKGGWLDKDKYQ